IFNWTGYRLRSLGRLQDAEDVFKNAPYYEETDDHWDIVFSKGINRSQVLLLLGKLPDAIDEALTALVAAEHSEDLTGRVFSRTTLGQAFHWGGKLNAAHKLFLEAETIHKSHGQEPDILCSSGGFKYCDLLLEVGKRQEVGERALVALRYAESHGWSMSTGLAALSLAMAESLIDSVSSQEICSTRFKVALEHLRKCGYVEYFVIGLLAHSRFSRIVNDIPKAERDLGEVEQIAGRSGMLIFQIEAALERCRLALTLDHHDEAHRTLDEAQALVKKTENPYEPHVPDWDEWEPPAYVGVIPKGEIVGYHRRNDEIAALGEALERLGA
ncbi:MAG: hypothetical protein IH820_02625, partial [Bacteroidetes bacterium]|nr:hypothetical protein [Bacteroidota bacterium]